MDFQFRLCYGTGYSMCVTLYSVAPTVAILDIDSSGVYVDRKIKLIGIEVDEI